MLGFPVSTEFNKRIPKQKFYENLVVSPTLRRVFVDQIRIVYWRNKLAASTLNIAAGEAVTEIEVFEVHLNEPLLDEAVLKQIDKEIPYHLLFILTCDGKAQAWIGYKEAAASGSNAFKVNHYYHKLDENKLWTILLGDDCAKTLCESFSELRNYRNDVMHAHDIGYERFNAAQKLFKKVNNELDLAIGKLIGAKEANTDVTPADFNSTLSSALAAVHSQVDTSSLLAASEALKGIVSNQPIINPEVSKSLSQIGRFAMGEYTLKPEVTAAIANLSKIAAVQSDMAPAMRAINDITKQIASYKIEIPPAVTELQQRLSEIEFGLLPNSSDAQQDNEEDKPNG